MDANTRNWAMILHLSLLSGFIIPLAGLVAPIAIWQLKKEEMPELDEHGRMILNFIISMFIYGVVSGILVVVFIGVLMLIALGIMGVVFPIIGGIKANNGEFWKYPLTLNLIK